jgi:hypothetical protein
VEYSEDKVGCITPSFESDGNVDRTNSLTLLVNAREGDATTHAVGQDNGCGLLPQCTTPTTTKGVSVTCQDVCNGHDETAIEKNIYGSISAFNPTATSGVCACRIYFWQGGRKQRDAAPETRKLDRCVTLWV